MVHCGEAVGFGDGKGGGRMPHKAKKKPRQPEQATVQNANSNLFDATLETIMVRGVKNGLRDINESTEFLHHNPNECKVMFNFTRHRVPQLEASWEAHWKKTYDVVLTTPRTGPHGDANRSTQHNGTVTVKKKMQQSQGVNMRHHATHHCSQD